MKLLKSGVLASAALLAACSPSGPEPEPVVFAGLRFSTDIDHNFSMPGHTTDITYSDLVTAELAKRDVNLDEIEVVRHSTDSRQLLVRLKNGTLDPAQQARIRSYLTSLVEDRNKANLGATLEVQPEPVHSTHSGKKPAVSVTPNQIAIEANDRYSANLFWRVSPLAALTYQPGINDLKCEVLFELRQALPYATFNGNSVAPGGLLNGTVNHKDRPLGSSGRVPVTVKFHDPDLIRLIDQGLVQPSLNSSQLLLPINRVGFIVGGIGEVDHVNGVVSFDVMSQSKQKCYHLAASLGRPFSFYIGDSMDRLSDVTFPEPATPD